MMLFLATASASDGIDEWIWLAAWFCMIVAALIALVSLGIAIFSRAALRHMPRLTILASLASIFPISFAAYVHRIDFVAVGGDGTPASGPLWRILLFPALPVVLAFVSLAVARQRSVSSARD